MPKIYLGAFGQIQDSKADANEIGTYFANTNGETPLNYPEGSSYYFLVSVGNVSRELCLQFAVDPLGNVYVRTYWNNWMPWVKIN